MHQQTTTLILLGLSLFLVASFTGSIPIFDHNLCVLFPIYWPNILKLDNKLTQKMSSLNSLRGIIFISKHVDTAVSGACQWVAVILIFEYWGLAS